MASNLGKKCSFRRVVLSSRRAKHSSRHVATLLRRAVFPSRRVISSCRRVISSCRRVISSSRVFLSLSSCPSAQLRLHSHSILVVPLYISGHYQRPPLLPVLAFFLIFPWLASLTRMCYSTVRCQVSWSSSRSFLKWSSVRWTETLPHCV